MKVNPFNPRLDLKHAPTIGRFIESKADIRIIKGPVGSGKTTGCCFDVLKVALEQERSPKDGVRYTRVVILRNTYAELKMTTIKTWREIYPEDVQGFGKIGGSPPISQHITIPGELDCEIFFLALDQPGDIRKLLSLNVSHIFFNELREFQHEIFLRAWDRVGRYPSKGFQGVECTRPCMIGDTNPPDEDHWLHDLEFNGEESLNLEFFNQPGAVIEVTGSKEEYKDVIRAAGHDFILNPKAENVPNLPTGYYQSKIPLNDRNSIRVYYESKYGVVGQGRPVTPEYDDDMMSKKDLKPISGIPLGIGADVGGGTLSPSAIIGQKGPRGIVLILAEIVCFDMGVEEFCNQINQTMAELFPGHTLEYGWGDPSGVKRDEIFETVVFDHMKSRGIPIKGAQTNAIQTRIEALRSPMKRLIDKIPGFLVHKRCKVLRAALAGKYVFRRLQIAGTARYAEKPDKGKYSHVADACGYYHLGTGEYQVIRGRAGQTKKLRPFQVKTGWDPTARRVNE